MMSVKLEHVNVTVADPEATAALYGRLFGWDIRWQGASIHGGHTVHVGSKDQYVALYRGPGAQVNDGKNYDAVGGLNHIAVLVDDLDALEQRIKAEGLPVYSHANYDPGRRFYFNDTDGIEYEAVSYG
jgi:catechol 2,3-dioxygenase-like lactoylglutathione lyase family enzyme